MYPYWQRLAAHPHRLRIAAELLGLLVIAPLAIVVLSLAIAGCLLAGSACRLWAWERDRSPQPARPERRPSAVEVMS